MIKMGEEMVDCKTEIDVEASAAEGLYPVWPIQISSSLFLDCAAALVVNQWR